MESNRSGRPHVAGITQALLAAAEKAMVSEGFTGLTVDRLVEEAGTTRPTFYRRFPSVAHIAFEVIRLRFGTGAGVDTGSLYEDLLALQRKEVEMFASPVFRNSLPGFLEAARSEPAMLATFLSLFIIPRRSNVARVLESAVARGEIVVGDIDVDFICDMLLGPVMARAVLPAGSPLDDRLAQSTTESVIAHISAAGRRRRVST
ncbi:TetR/AcrR family transcriptional regulator [Cryobacterium sp. TMT1-2-2]|uniref:TetR/AcrR family transcriptional regulator n=1 Tax=Cryobacterium sp. TMT1-2-2 TaxID=1259233 RepID=UPI00106ACEA0|nr:TetR/AcrR family transcriptional regulator [Cryobacterium sp. TMT1-2-2]TFD11648.1 TetR/AcrR family transcriptional regulator [Cryobacterium sp. TMT1-2-2]